MKKAWKAIGMAVAYFAIFMGIQLAVSFLGAIVVLTVLMAQNGIELFADMNRYIQLYTGEILKNTALIVIISNLLTILGSWLYLRQQKKSYVMEMRLQKTTWKNLLLSVGYGFGMCFLVDLLTLLLPVPETVMEQFAQMHATLWMGNPIVAFLSVAVIAPVTEELLFRGFCHNALKKGMPTIWAAVLSAVLFGIAHGNPVWFLVGFAAGLALAWIYERTGCLWCAIVVHLTNNLIAFITGNVVMPEALGYVLIGAAVVVFPIMVFLLMKENPRLSRKQRKQLAEAQAELTEE